MALLGTFKLFYPISECFSCFFYCWKNGFNKFRMIMAIISGFYLKLFNLNKISIRIRALWNKPDTNSGNIDWYFSLGPLCIIAMIITGRMHWQNELRNICYHLLAIVVWRLVIFKVKCLKKTNLNFIFFKTVWTLDCLLPFANQQPTRKF